jgi:alpha-D-xyloside xylohydrolase
MMRALVMDFAHDKKACDISDQFMLGPSLMICPVYTYKATSRKVYLPAGQGWYDLYTGKYFEGGQEIDADAPYERVPVFVKEGSILLTGPELQYAGEKKADPIVVHVYAGKDAEFTLYEDAGTNYDYEQGMFSTIEFQYDEAGKTLTISDRKGSYAGMLKKRKFFVQLIDKEQAQEIQFDIRKKRPISYSGKRVKEKH